MENSVLNTLIIKKPRNNHLDSSKFHLNRGGGKILSNTFTQHISNDNCQIIDLIVIFSTFDFGKYGQT